MADIYPLLVSVPNCALRFKQGDVAHPAATTVVLQAELLQQEIINRQRLSIAAGRLVDDLPKQAQAAEERMFMAEYVRGYQLVGFPVLPCLSRHRSYHISASMICIYNLIHLWDLRDHLAMTPLHAYSQQ